MTHDPQDLSHFMVITTAAKAYLIENDFSLQCSLILNSLKLNICVQLLDVSIVEFCCPRSFLRFPYVISFEHTL